MSKNRYRFNLVLSAELGKKIKELRKITGITTLTQLVIRAIEVYGFFIQKKNEGCTLVMKKEGEPEKEIFVV